MSGLALRVGAEMKVQKIKYAFLIIVFKRFFAHRRKESQQRKLLAFFVLGLWIIEISFFFMLTDRRKLI